MRVIGEHDLGPVHVGRRHEGKLVSTEVKLAALLDNNAAARKIGAEVVLHHLEGHGRGNNLSLGIALHKSGDACGVIRFHMVHNQVVGRATVEHSFEVAQPLIDEMGVDGIGDGNLVGKNHIAVVRHAVFAHVVLALEQIDVVVVDANVADILGNLHDAPISS